MKQALIITGGNIDIEQLRSTYEQMKGDCFVLGVDGGCQAAIQADLTMDAIIGDFDTLDPLIKESITNKGTNTINLNPIKNVTDTHAALDYLSEQNYSDVLIIGGRGTRQDHSIGNLMTSFAYIPEMNIELIDRTNRVRPYKGPLVIKNFKQGDYKYVSIIPIEETYIKKSQGLKYEINNKVIKPYDSLGVSNELTNHKDPYIEVEYGKLLIIESND